MDTTPWYSHFTPQVIVPLGVMLIGIIGAAWKLARELGHLDEAIADVQQKATVAAEATEELDRKVDAMGMELTKLTTRCEERHT